MSILIPSIGKKEGKLQVFTIEECTACSLKTKRPFKLGDYVFKEGGRCTKCNGNTRIVMIQAEQAPRSNR